MQGGAKATLTPTNNPTSNTTTLEFEFGEAENYDLSSRAGVGGFEHARVGESQYAVEGDATRKICGGFAHIEKQPEPASNTKWECRCDCCQSNS